MKPAHKSDSFLIICFCILVIGVAANCSNDPTLEAVDESYKPDQPIEFPHDLHAGKHGIDCKFCHNSADDGKTAGIPTVNICLKCHKQINGNQTPDGTENR